MHVAHIARVCHEANRAVQIIQADPSIAPAPPWDECGSEMRASVIAGVEGVLAGNTPEESHQSWVQFKVDHGWVYGLEKNEELRTHPLIKDYDELPAAQKIKDDLFVAIVKTLS